MYHTDARLAIHDGCVLNEHFLADHNIQKMTDKAKVKAALVIPTYEWVSAEESSVELVRLTDIVPGVFAQAAVSVTVTTRTGTMEGVGLAKDTGTRSLTVGLDKKLK